MKTATILCLHAILASSLCLAQDMPLSQVLIEGEDWHVVSEGHDFNDGAAEDGDGNFYFADVKSGTTINKLSLEGKLSTFVDGVEKISGLQFGPDGRIYCCQVGKYGRIIAFDSSGKMSVIADDVKPNDLVVTHDGGIYFTETAKQQVTYIPPGGKPIKAGEGPLKPNGITLSPDQSTLAVSDYGGENVWVWRIENDGKLNFSQPYMTMRTPGEELPAKGDGMATDAYGRYYVTSAEGLQMFDPTGRMGGVIASPQDKPLVSVTFAGPDLSYLYVCCGDKIYRRKTRSKGICFFDEPVTANGIPRK